MLPAARGISTTPSPLLRPKSCPEEQEAATSYARVGFGLRIPASKTHLLTEIPAQAVTQAQDPCGPTWDAKGAWINQSGLIKHCSTPMWLISPKLRQSSFNLVSFSCKIEVDKARHWPLVWISGSMEEFNVCQSLPSKLAPMSAGFCAGRAVGSGSWLSWFHEADLTQPNTQSFEPAKNNSCPTLHAAHWLRGQTRPYLCPPTPLPTLAAAAPEVPAEALQAAASLEQYRVLRAQPERHPQDRVAPGCSRVAPHWALGSRSQIGGVLK